MKTNPRASSAQDKGPIVSFHPVLKGDVFVWERGIIKEELAGLLAGARAVILPQTVSRELYHMCRALCPRVFPNYDLRFKWEGKVGDTMLFWSLGVPHPRTWIFPRVEALTGLHPAMGHEPGLPDYPFVLKGARGGEGSQTYLVKNEKDLQGALYTMKRLEWQGKAGFVLQEFIDGLDRDLRVVVIGKETRSYWRINPRFHKNVARGGTIDKESEPGLQAAGRQLVRELCRRTGINLAGFDLIFPPGSSNPLFLEVNYTFGRTGIGGSEGFYSLLEREVEHWLRG